MCVVSKVDELITQSTDDTIQWLDALNPLIIKLKRCVEVMCSRATIGLTFFALQVATATTVLQPCVLVYLGEPVPKEMQLSLPLVISV